MTGGVHGAFFGVHGADPVIAAQKRVHRVNAAFVPAMPLEASGLSLSCDMIGEAARARPSRRATWTCARFRPSHRASPRIGAAEWASSSCELRPRTGIWAGRGRGSEAERADKIAGYHPRLRVGHVGQFTKFWCGYLVPQGPAQKHESHPSKAGTRETAPRGAKDAKKAGNFPNPISDSALILVNLSQSVLVRTGRIYKCTRENCAPRYLRR